MPLQPKHRFRAAAAALILIAAVVFCGTWLMMREDAPLRSGPPVLPPRRPSLPQQSAGAPLPRAQPADPRAIDPEIQKLADLLAEKMESPQRDVEIVGEFITLYSRVFHGNPIGLNEDITAVLTGHNHRKGILFPPGSPMIVRGQLVDRWGTPYWFHANSSYSMEVRSAGPDKDLFSGDDVVLNPSTGDLGAQPQHDAAMVR